MIQIGFLKNNTMIKRLCLVAELAVVLLYEHVRRQTQVTLLFLAAAVGLVAGAAFFNSESASEIDTQTEEIVPNHRGEQDPATVHVLDTLHPDTLAYLNAIEVPEEYRHQWLALVFQTKSLRRQVHLNEYESIIDLGKASEWKAPQLREIMKAATSVNRRFSVELTSDSILIHCDPALPAPTEHAGTLPTLVAVSAVQ